MTPSASAGSLAPGRTSGAYLDLVPDDFLPNFNARACFVKHRLTGHPLLALPRLLELAEWLPKHYVRINSGAVPVYASPDQIPGTGLPIAESFARIESSDTRIMLKKIELHPDYRDLLHTCLEEIESLGHPESSHVHSREGYVFISAPNMTTPFHMDPEINFLLQTQGRKAFRVLPGDDRTILSEEEIERFYAGAHRSLSFKEDARAKAVTFDMAPGDGVHIPVNHPHWVTTGNEVTVSFALTLQTAGTHRRGAIYAINHQLRKRGLCPTPFGSSPTRDFLKHQGYRLWRAIKSCLPHRKAGQVH